MAWGLIVRIGDALLWAVPKAISVLRHWKKLRGIYQKGKEGSRYGKKSKEYLSQESAIVYYRMS